MDLGGLDRQTNAWLYVVPSKRIRPKECDELPYEFIRAGIGVCFEGIHYTGYVAGYRSSRL